MLHCLHARNSVPTVAVASPLPSLRAHPLPGTGVPQPCDVGLVAAITPTQSLAGSLPVLCPQVTSSGLRHGPDSFLFAEHAQMPRGLATLKVANPGEGKAV